MAVSCAHQLGVVSFAPSLPSSLPFEPPLPARIMSRISRPLPPLPACRHTTQRAASAASLVSAVQARHDCKGNVSHAGQGRAGQGRAAQTTLTSKPPLNGRLCLEPPPPPLPPFLSLAQRGASQQL